MNSNGRRYAIDYQEVLARLCRYGMEGLVLGFACYAIPNGKLDVHEIVTIALVAAATYSLLDVFSPTMGSSARMGTGLMVGARIGGFNGGPDIARR